MYLLHKIICNIKKLPCNIKVSSILHSYYYHYKFWIGGITNYWDESVCGSFGFSFTDRPLTFVSFLCIRTFPISNWYKLLREEDRRKYLNIMFCNVFTIFQQLLDQPHSQFIQVEWFMKIWSQKWEKCQLLSFVKAYWLWKHNEEPIPSCKEWDRPARRGLCQQEDGLHVCRSTLQDLPGGCSLLSKSIISF